MTTTHCAGEHADLLEALATRRSALRLTARGVTDEHVRLRTTASRLCLGGLIKHVSWGERTWVEFIEHGPAAKLSASGDLAGAAAAHRDSFRMRDGETLAGLLEHYEQVARHTDELLGVADLDRAHPLPRTPWFAPGARWSARRVLLHVIAETAQHAGHADLVRQALDGVRSTR